jgi:hypothetical protein
MSSGFVVDRDARGIADASPAGTAAGRRRLRALQKP